MKFLRSHEGFHQTCPMFTKFHLSPGMGSLTCGHTDIPTIRKSEIEKIVIDLLQLGVVRMITSPYSSPVLLVKKTTMGCGGYVWIIEHSTK